MKLRSKLMMFTAALALSTGMAAAAITGNGVLATFQADGYTYIEVKEGLTQIKVEAIKGTTYMEVIYDKESGLAIKTETGTASAEDAAQTGTSVKIVNRDFEDANDDENDDMDDVDNDDDDENDIDEDDIDEDEDEDEDEVEEDEDEDENNSGGSGSGGDSDCDD